MMCIRKMFWIYLFIITVDTVYPFECDDRDLKNDLHYEEYPYPPYDPESELEEPLSKVEASSLAEINHYIYGGKGNFENFRVLIAGGGTGSSLIYFAHQLEVFSATNAEIVYLDFTYKSLQIAKRRVELREFKNIKFRFIHDSILNISNLNLGEFDMINCVGVLHHMPDPDLGLQILKQSLKPDGGMVIMVYAKYGRIGVYLMQDLMQRINKAVGATNFQQEINNTKNVIESLPDNHWIMNGLAFVNDYPKYKDAGLYDMYLHKRDVAYSIPELYEFIEDRGGLVLVDHCMGYDRMKLFPSRILNNPKLSNKITENLKFREIERKAIGELMSGDLIKHSIYVTHRKDTEADINDRNNVPFFIRINDKSLNMILAALKTNLRSNQELIKFSIKTNEKNFRRTYEWPVIKYVTASLINTIMKEEDMSLNEIYESCLKKELKPLKYDADQLHAVFKTFYEAARTTGHMLLRHKDSTLNERWIERNMEIVVKVKVF